LIAWEIAVNRNVSWAQGRTFPRLVGFGALSNVLVPTFVFVIGASFGETFKIGVISPALYVAASGAGFYYYQFHRTDLLMLTMLVFAAILLVNTLAGRYLPMDTGTILLLALLLIGQVAAAAYWLRNVTRRQESER